MAQITIDLDAQMDKIDKRREELRVMSINPGGADLLEKENRRSQIKFWRADLLVKETLLEDIKTENDAATIMIKQLTKEEVERAQKAMDDLDKEIKKDQVWRNVIETAMAVLGGASRTVLTAAKK